MSDYKSAAEMFEFQASELRNRDEALARVVQERDAAIRECNALEAVLVRIRSALGLSDDAMGWHMIEWAERLSQIQQEHVVVLQERDEAIRERDLARAHDAQPYPTAEAYERVCSALEQAKSLADFWEAEAVKHARGERAIKAERESNQTAYIRSLQSELHVERGRNRDLQVEVWKAQGRADRAEALLREAARWVELEAGFSLSVTIREQAQALLVKIREALA